MVKLNNFFWPVAVAVIVAVAFAGAAAVADCSRLRSEERELLSEPTSL